MSATVQSTVLTIDDLAEYLKISNPDLVAARCQSIREMELANLFCWLVAYSQE